LRRHFGVFLCGDQPGQAAVLHRAHLFSRDTLVMSAMLLPLVPVGVWLGMRLLKWIPERPFYLLATAALGLSGVKLLWDGVVG
jgi:uncharacterized membrane protein YfcA